MPPRKRKARSAAAAAEDNKEVAKAKKSKAEEKKSKAEEARRKKEQLKAQKEAEAAAKERKELHERAERVVAVLEGLKKSGEEEAFSSKDDVEPIFVKVSSTSLMVPRALFNAVECQDLKRARAILESTRFAVDAEGQKVEIGSDKDAMEVDGAQAGSKQPELTRDQELLGWKWKIPFDCPCSKKSGGNAVNALVVALANGQMEMVHLLTQYFGWAPVLGNETQRQNSTYRRGHTFGQSTSCLTTLVTSFGQTSVPQNSMELLVTKDAFVEQLPQLTLSAMRLGRLAFVRRVLRFYLGLTMDLSVSVLEKLGRKTLKGTLGVTPLHLLALEAANLDGAELNEKAANAPALDMFVTPLHLAALSGNLAVYRALEEAGGDWTIQTNDNTYALQYAAAAPNTAIHVVSKITSKKESKGDRKRTKQGNRKKTEDDNPDEGAGDEADPTIAKFQETVQPSSTLRYMTNLEDESGDEDLQHEFAHILPSDCKRSVLETAVRAGRHHNVAWLIHWFDEKDSTKWYAWNGESGVLRSVIQGAPGNGVDMMALFLVQPKFRSSLLSDGSDLVSTAVGRNRVDMLRLFWDEYKTMDDKEKVTIQGTPIHLQTAIQNESLCLAKALVKEGRVDVDSAEVPKSALHVACGMDFVECAVFLVDECDANPRAETSPDCVSAMQVACRSASIGCIQVLLSKGVSLDLQKENEVVKMQKEEEEKKKEEAAGDENEMETETASPFEGHFMVLTGVFSVSKEVIRNVVESHGGKIQPQVNGKTTHCVYSGKDGINDYGQKMGKGDKKYTAAKRKKLPFLNENDILRYLKRAGQGIASHESTGNLSAGARDGKKGNEEASFLHDVIKNALNKNQVLPSVEILLKFGADVGVEDDYGRTALHYAVIHLNQSESNAQLLSVLDPNGDLVNKYDLTGMTPVLQACVSGKWDFVGKMMPCLKNVNIFAQEPAKEKGNEASEEPLTPKAPKFQNKYNGWSLAHFLLMHKKVDLFHSFINLGGNVNTTTRTDDVTPLIVASICSPEICRSLLVNPDCLFNAANAKGKTLLHAIFSGVSVGTSLSAQQQKEYNDQLLEAPHTMQANRPAGDGSIISLTNMLRWCPGLDTSLKDVDGTTVFHAACATEDTTSCIRILLDKDKNVLHESNGLGNTPLALAFLNRKLHVSLFLMDQGANINGHVYWRRNVEEQVSNNVSSRRRQNTQHNLLDEDGEPVSETLLRMSIYTYVMKANLPADVIYNMLRLPSCDLSAALSASITTGNLNWTEQLLRSVDVQTPEKAGEFVRLLFSSSSMPAAERQQKMIGLSRKLVTNASGVTLDTEPTTGQNIIHLAVGKNRMSTATTGELLKLLGKDLSIKAILATDRHHGRSPLHMAVIDNNAEVSQLLLSHTKEHGGLTELEKLLDSKDKLSKTALHYAVSSNSLGTYLNGEMLSLLVRFGANVTLPDGSGLTVATVIGQMPPSQLDHFKLALAGEDTDSASDSEAKLPKEAEEQIDKAQAKRKESLLELAQKNDKERKDHARRWDVLQKQWEQFRKERLKAKPLVFQETREKALEGRLDIPVDHSCPDQYAYQVHIGNSGDVFDALLVTTDLRHNIFGSNSFHALQLVELTESFKKKRVGQAAALANAQQNEALYAYRLGMAKYRVVERWGRIGDWDTKSRAQGFTQLSKAQQYFEKVFSDKTRNVFSERENFDHARGSYNWVQKVYDETEADETTGTKVDGALPHSVATLLRTITSLTRVRQDLRDGGFGVEGLPLQQLSPNTVSEGYGILHEIEELVAELDGIDKLRGRSLRENRTQKYELNSKLADLSNKFYATIPHDFGNVNSGFKKPEVINNRNALEKNLKMLQSLEDVESSINLLLGVSSHKGLHQRLGDIYDLIGCSLKAVPQESDEFQLIRRFAALGSRGQSIRISHLLHVDRFEDSVRFEPHEKSRGLNDKNGQPQNRLLWHATKMSNALGILMKGFKIAPPEAPSSGYNFGKGIYLADVFSKSASYSSRRRFGYSKQMSDVDHFRVMFLCEVALGESHKLRNPNPDLTEPPDGFDSVQAIGREAPDTAGMFLTKEGVGLPLGEVRPAPLVSSVMGHNEYVVYDESRVRIKYVMLFE